MSKTTLLGVLTIVAGVVGFAIAAMKGVATEPASLAAFIATITTGVGLIKAADSTP